MFEYVGDFDSLGKGCVNVAENGKNDNETDLHLVFTRENVASLEKYIRRPDRSDECKVCDLLSAHWIFPENTQWRNERSPQEYFA